MALGLVEVATYALALPVRALGWVWGAFGLTAVLYWAFLGAVATLSVAVVTRQSVTDTLRPLFDALRRRVWLPARTRAVAAVYPLYVQYLCCRRYRPPPPVVAPTSLADADRAVLGGGLLSPRGRGGAQRMMEGAARRLMTITQYWTRSHGRDALRPTQLQVVRQVAVSATAATDADGGSSGEHGSAAMRFGVDVSWRAPQLRPARVPVNVTYEIEVDIASAPGAPPVLYSRIRYQPQPNPLSPAAMSARNSRYRASGKGETLTHFIELSKAAVYRVRVRAVTQPVAPEPGPELVPAAAVGTATSAAIDAAPAPAADAAAVATDAAAAATVQPTASATTDAPATDATEAAAPATAAAPVVAPAPAIVTTDTDAAAPIPDPAPTAARAADATGAPATDAAEVKAPADASASPAVSAAAPEPVAAVVPAKPVAVSGPFSDRLEFNFVLPRVLFLVNGSPTPTPAEAAAASERHHSGIVPPPRLRLRPNLSAPHSRAHMLHAWSSLPALIGNADDVRGLHWALLYHSLRSRNPTHRRLASVVLVAAFRVRPLLRDALSHRPLIGLLARPEQLLPSALAAAGSAGAAAAAAAAMMSPASPSAQASTPLVPLPMNFLPPLPPSAATGGTATPALVRAASSMPPVTPVHPPSAAAVAAAAKSAGFEVLPAIPSTAPTGSGSDSGGPGGNGSTAAAALMTPVTAALSAGTAAAVAHAAASFLKLKGKITPAKEKTVGGGTRAPAPATPRHDPPPVLETAPYLQKAAAFSAPPPPLAPAAFVAEWNTPSTNAQADWAAFVENCLHAGLLLVADGEQASAQFVRAGGWHLLQHYAHSHPAIAAALAQVFVLHSRPQQPPTPRDGLAVDDTTPALDDAARESVLFELCRLASFGSDDIRRLLQRLVGDHVNNPYAVYAAAAGPSVPATPRSDSGAAALAGVLSPLAPISPEPAPAPLAKAAAAADVKHSR